MYISTKIAVAALAATAGLGIPVGYWAAQAPPGHPREESGETEADEHIAPDPATPDDDPRAREALPSVPADSEPDDTPRPDDAFRASPTPPEVVEPAEPIESPEEEVSTLPAAPKAEAALPVASERPERVPCGSVECAGDQVCCNESCGICTGPGGTCTNKICGRPELPVSQLCGPNTCNVGKVCCNASCGICTEPGASCSQRQCNGPTFPFSVPCGMSTCNVGLVCCNASCGICAAPGASCPQKLCSW